MLSVVVFIHCINDGIHLGVFVIFLLFYFIIFYALFSFKFFSNVHPNPAIHRLATTVKRLRLLPGVTTLSRDFYRRPILGASNHFYLYLFIAWNLSLLE